MPLTSPEKADLFAQARRAMGNAYCPYSGFAVGAALRCADGDVFAGCNVENASYGAAICAERNAVAAAIEAGKRDFTDIAIVCSGNGFAAPCGICRQVLRELAPDAAVHLLRADGAEKTLFVRELLPEAFELNV